MAFRTVKTWTDAADFALWSNGRVPLSSDDLALIFAPMIGNGLSAANLKARWPIAQTGAVDDVVGSIDLAPVNSPTIVANGLSCDDINQSVSMPDNALLRMAGRDVTIDMIFFDTRHDVGVQERVWQYTTANDFRWKSTNISALKWGNSNADITVPNGLEEPGAWNLLRLSYNGANVGSEVVKFTVAREDGNVTQHSLTIAYTGGSVSLKCFTNVEAILSQMANWNEYTTDNPTHNLFEVGAAHTDGLWPYIDTLHAPGGSIRVTATFTVPTGGTVEARVRRLHLAGVVDPDSGPAWSAFTALTSTTAATLTPPTRGNFVQIQLRLTPKTDALKTTSPVVSNVVLETDTLVGGPLIISGRDQNLDQSLFI